LRRRTNDAAGLAREVTTLIKPEDEKEQKITLVELTSEIDEKQSMQTSQMSSRQNYGVCDLHRKTRKVFEEHLRKMTLSVPQKV
jgi:hypothetical protein